MVSAVSSARRAERISTILAPAGAIVRSGLGRVVYALSTEQAIELNPGSDWPTVRQDGPALFDEARVPIERYYRTGNDHHASTDTDSTP